MHKVLLIEDSTEAAQLVRRTFGPEIQLEWVKTVREAASQLEKADYDLILLDATLPDGDGFQLCSVLQAQDRWSQVPIILLTARNSVFDKVMAFSIGADDFISKPFDSLELKARVESKLRKKERRAQISDILICNDLEINKGTQKVFVLDNGRSREIDLTPREFKILLYMASRPNIVLTRDEILNAVWGENIHVYGRSVDTHVSKLRRKLGDKADLIVSVHGIGYRFKNDNTEKAPLTNRSDEPERLQLGYTG